jgi:YggT family protein
MSTLSGFINALYYVYVLMIIAWVVLQMLPIPRYNPIVRAITDFLDQTVLPYVRLFRRVIPMAGPLDLSPMIALIVLFAARQVLRAVFNV